MFQVKNTLRRISEKRHSDEGFTLIELMVVVLIIGILVAIAIPLFLNATNGANTSSVRSDAKNEIVEQRSYFSNNQAYSSATLTKVTSGNTVTSAVSGTQVTITALSNKVNTCYVAVLQADGTMAAQKGTKSGATCGTLATTTDLG